MYRMGLFRDRDIYRGYNIYSLKKYVDKKRIILNILIICSIIIMICVVIYYVINTTVLNKRKKALEQQVLEYIEEQAIQQQAEQEEAERQSKIPKLTEEGKENIKNIYNSENKRAFLTFDDGPSNNTKDILNILNENDIKATFFVLGCQVEVFPETTKKIYDEGHYIANHGDTHVYTKIYISSEEVLNEYNNCNQKVANAIGIAEYNSHLFRFPGGSTGGKYAEIKAQAITLLEENEVVYVDWNALTGDSEKQSPTEEYMMENLQRTAQNKNSIVVLMHDSQAKVETVNFLPKVIEYLREQGYEFQSFYDIIK